MLKELSDGATHPNPLPLLLLICYCQIFKNCDKKSAEKEGHLVGISALVQATFYATTMALAAYVGILPAVVSEALEESSEDLRFYSL